ncbi:FAD-dependent oxidoreductase [Pontiellaceae bacterium B12227]|nr:FAD-dependent oxidoreductase [Pontiellaceae bacterium B12227]
MTVKRFDVVVAGGGSSGVPAAVAAARSGARVALIEQTGRLGGTPVAGLGFPICGMFLADYKKPTLVNEGLVREFLDASDGEVERRGRVQLLRCSGEMLEQIYNAWVDAEPNLKLFTDVDDLQVFSNDGRIESFRFQGLELEAGAVIDCTGRAAVAKRCGADLLSSKNPALAGFILRLSHVVPNEMLPIRVPHLLWKTAESGRLPAAARYTVFDRDLLKVSVEPGADAEALALNIFSVLKAELPEFQCSEIVETSTGRLEREGVRLKGTAVLDEQSVRSGARFDDAAAKGCWPMEFWDAEKGVLYSYVDGDGTYDIPMRALRSNTVSNLWTAGRSVSADSMALSSVRVVGTCMAVGEAVGAAAAKEAA